MLDRWTAINFSSRENRMEQIGPSSIESVVEAARGEKGVVFHEKTCVERQIRKIKYGTAEVKQNSSTLINFRTTKPDQM